MASACVNNVGVTPGKFSSYGWLSPRVSFTRDEEAKSSKGKATTTTAAAAAKEREKVCYKADLENDAAEFEFRLDDPVAMLPADELISDGKLMPMLQVTTVAKQSLAAEARLPETVRTRRITEVLSSGVDPYLFSPKAPKCTSRWKEILGLKKLRQNSVNNNEVKSSSASTNKSLKNFLHHRNSKSSSSSSSDSSGLSLPLLRESDCESLSMSSRLSLSSSSSGHELEDFPRLSLDAEKQNINPISLLKSVANSNPNNHNPPTRVRLVKPRPAENGGPRMGKSHMRRTATEPTNAAVAAAFYGVSIDSPRMNPSGKIVFQSLGRSSSSPSSFNGGARFHHSGMERSYSANVRVVPVLNVPVCSLSKSGSVLGFGQLFSSHQKRDSNGGGSRSYQSINNNSRNRTDRN